MTELPEELKKTLKAFGSKIAALRKQQGWTRHKLSEKSGISLSTVIRVERGETNLALETITRLSWALDQDVDVIFRKSAPMTSPAFSINIVF